MEHSHRYFRNIDCKYYPCHEGMGEEFNCLFCYCPLYRLEKCPGTPGEYQQGGKIHRDCSQCTFPHKPENYEKIISLLERM